MSEQTADAIGEITLTDKAVAEIASIRNENSIPDEYYLRIGVKGGGCSGLTYSLGFDGDKRDSDEILDINGVRILVDAKSLYYLDGTELDYTDGLNGKGFVFNNPNAVRSCGCGSSFGV
ncbi:MAG: iron-sulfur cluster assembly accessory protein [Bacteroidetes bacterium]|nr:iron-sulfur cluster assembly accessory protein [Bacteroidota bacterium]